jgi:hypothetical protein
VSGISDRSSALQGLYHREEERCKNYFTYE